METIATEEEIKQECIKRMKLLKLNNYIIKEFEKTGYIYVYEENKESEKADDELMQIMKKYQEKRDIRVYYILVSYKYDNIYNWDFYYVSNYKDEWNNNEDKIHYEWRREIETEEKNT